MLKRENLTIKELYNLDNTLAKGLLENKQYPWEALPFIEDYILSLGATLSKIEYKLVKGADVKKNVWLSKTARIAKDANLYGPLIVGHNTEIRHNAFIGSNVIIGENCVIGNSAEIKNSILLNYVQVTQFNFVGYSILGNSTYLGAGVVLSSSQRSKCNVYIERTIDTGLRKVGAFVSDNVEIGCNSVFSPGTVIGKNTIIYPSTYLTGFIPSDCVVSTKFSIVEKGMK